MSTQSHTGTIAEHDTLPFRTRHGLPADARRQVCLALNATLADLSDLRSQVKQAHWNVKGPSFFGLHQLFDQIAGSLLEPVDSVAERVLALGGFARGTVRMAAEHSGLDELPAEFRQEDIVADIADRVARAASLVRARIDETEDAGDKVSADLLTGIAASLDKSLYFLEACAFRGDNDPARH